MAGIRRVDVIRSAYELDGTDREWLGRLTGKLVSMVGRGRGAMAWLLRQTPAEPPARWRAAEIYWQDPCTRAQAQTLEVALWACLPEPLRCALDSPGARCISAREAGLFAAPAIGQAFAPDVRDAICALATTPDGDGCGFVIPVVGARRLSASTTRSIERVLVHVSVGLRLRRLKVDDIARAAIASLPAEERARAVDRLGVREESVRGVRALRQVAVAMDERGAATGARDEAMARAVYEGLLTSEWTLIDHFWPDESPYRFVVACQVEPGARTGLQLTAAELDALRVMLAYTRKDTGGAYLADMATMEDMSEKRLYTHGNAARRKIGVRSLIELFAVLRADIGHDER